MLEVDTSVNGNTKSPDVPRTYDSEVSQELLPLPENVTAFAENSLTAPGAPTPPGYCRNPVLSWPESESVRRVATRIRYQPAFFRVKPSPEGATSGEAEANDQPFRGEGLQPKIVLFMTMLSDAQIPWDCATPTPGKPSMPGGPAGP